MELIKLESLFNSWRSKEQDQHNIYLDLPDGRLQIFFWSLVDRRHCAEGQRSPGKLKILQEGNLQGTAGGCPRVIKDELVGKRPVSLVLS